MIHHGAIVAQHSPNQVCVPGSLGKLADALGRIEKDIPDIIQSTFGVAVYHYNVSLTLGLIKEFHHEEGVVEICH